MNVNKGYAVILPCHDFHNRGQTNVAYVQGDPKKIGISVFFIVFCNFFLGDCHLYHKNRKLFIFSRFSEIHRAQ